MTIREREARAPRRVKSGERAPLQDDESAVDGI